MTTFATVVIEFVAGLSLILGYKIRWGALALAAFTVVVTFIFHFDFTDQTQILFFTKNAAILGGLLYISAMGGSHYSLDNRNA